MPLLPTTKERLFKSTKPNPATGCVEWTGCVGPNGYGAIHWNASVMLVHRVAWTIERGVIPNGLYVLHRCDNKICVNADHLFLGTHRDNIEDCFKKGRFCRGERHSHAKLKESQVLEIAHSKDNYANLAKRFGVSEWSIKEIKFGRNWAWLTKLRRRGKIKKQAITNSGG